MKGAALIFCTVLCFSQESTLPADITCVLTYRQWALFDNLYVSWTVPDSIATRQNLNVNVTWFNLYRIGIETCDEKTMTSCKWNYGSVGIYSDFILNVSITDKINEILFQQQWLINPDDCRLPPPITTVVADVVNSTCVDVSWYYGARCTGFDRKLYRILVSNKQIISVGSGLVTLCNSSHRVCDLRPFTNYTFIVQCKAADFFYTPRGYFSNSSTVSARTLSDVPTEAPVMVDGGYSYIENMCDTNNTRKLEIYWKDIPSDSKNGLIETFNLTVFNQNEIRHVTVGGDLFSTTLVLRCDVSYDVINKARTDAGPSAYDANMKIPLYAQGDDIIDEVIPIYDNNSFRVFWTLKASGSYLNTTQFVLFWCPQTSKQTYAVDWISVPASPSGLTLSLENGISPHRYQIGLATKHTGIHWAPCYYLNSSELEPPDGLDVDDDVSLPYGSLIVKWVNPPCHSRSPGPFVRFFILECCKVTDINDKMCIGDLYNVKIGKDKSAYTFTGLEPGAVYKLSISAVGLTDLDTQSSRSRSVWGRASMASDGISTKLIIIAVIAVFFVFAMFITVCCRAKRKFTRLYKEKFKISTPEDKINSINGIHTSRTEIPSEARQIPVHYIRVKTGCEILQ